MNYFHNVIYLSVVSVVITLCAGNDIHTIEGNEFVLQDIATTLSIVHGGFILAYSRYDE